MCVFREAVVAAAGTRLTGEPADGRKANEEMRGIPRTLGVRLHSKEAEKAVLHKEPLGLGMAKKQDKLGKKIVTPSTRFKEGQSHSPAVKTHFEGVLVQAPGAERHAISYLRVVQMQRNLSETRFFIFRMGLDCTPLHMAGLPMN